MFNICPENDIDSHEVGLAWLDESASDLAFPDALNPLTNALECTDVLEQCVNLWRFKLESDNGLTARVNRILRQITLKVLVFFLINNSQQIKQIVKRSTYLWDEFVGAILLHGCVLEAGVTDDNLSKSVLLALERVDAIV